jgi:hypothetical protein
MAAGSEPADQTRGIHHRTDELLVKQHTISDGQAACPVEEMTKHAQSLSCLLFHPVDVCRSGKPCINGQLKITKCIHPLYWLSEKLHWFGFLDALGGLGKEHSDTLTLIAILQSSNYSSSLSR